jgi:hypothetical protein
MDTVLETRIRAAGAEMTKPGRWRVALEELEQAATQLLASTDDPADLQMLLHQLMGLYQFASVMQNHELRRLNQVTLQVSNAIESK